MMKLKSDRRRSLLGQLSDEMAALAERVVQSTAIVTGQTGDLSECEGSAWLYDAEHLLTNHHVVDSLVEPILVRFPSRPAVQTLVVGRDPMTDLAVLRVDPQTVQPLRLADRPARLGELCFAFGSPLGDYPESISIGIVSGLKRSLPTADKRAIYDVIQTDCAINPGNSGGPLVDIDGLVLGMNTAGISDADGIGFAISAGTVADIARELLTHGAVERASLGIGVALRPVEAIPGGEGLAVTSVGSKPAGPFERGDVLLAIGDRPIRNQHDLLRALRHDVVDRKIAVRVWRAGQERSIECLPRSMRPADRAEASG